ncbi:MAG: substrate-binding domain-containing protein [Bacteroidales bacterium]|nr:substrate-binding domain-containing protein [Bacteroidales bacterium]
MKNLNILCCLLIIACCNQACNRKSLQEYDYIIGVSYQNLQNEFIINIQDAIREKAGELNVKLYEVDGQGKAENQIAQVENFLALDVDAIILNPFDTYGSAPVVSIANREMKPVIVVNSVVVNLDKANAYVGSNDREAGRIAAGHIAELLEGKGAIAMIRGPNGHSAEIQRTEGILEIMDNHQEMEIIFDQSGNWDRTQGLELMENWLSTGKQIDAVIAQNDEMALGAQKAVEAAGKQNDILVIGIDAIPDALRAVQDGKLCATVFQDARGQGILSLELAIRVIRGDSIKHTHYIPFQLVTKENLSEFQTN